MPGPGSRGGKPQTITIKRGPRKGQRILAYVRPNGKWTEVKRGRGATAQRRSAARAGGLKDRFGRTAQDRGKVRATQKAARVKKRLSRGLSRSGGKLVDPAKFRATRGKGKVTQKKVSKPVSKGGAHKAGGRKKAKRR